MKVKNPTGRLDWLAAKLLERAVEQRGNPFVSAMYGELRSPIEELLTATMGPRNRNTRKLKKYIAEGNKYLAKLHERQRKDGQGGRIFGTPDGAFRTVNNADPGLNGERVA